MEHRNKNEPISKRDNKWKACRKCSLILTFGLVLFSAGFFTQTLLFPVFSQTGKTNESLFDLQAELDLSSLSVLQAYQRIIRALDILVTRQANNPNLKTEIAILSEQIEQLRTLNPYYHFEEIRSQTVPSGEPAVYGRMLGLSFDQVSASLEMLAAFDPTYGPDGVELNGEDAERYIRVGSQTACLYCCEAKTLVQANGTAACGCAHSQAMRGLAAHLIINHPQDYDDQALVTELNRWRAAYFPKQTLITALQLRRDAGEAGIKEILVEFPEFMPAMVGDC